MNFCEGCHGCTKPCGKEEKAWYYKEEVKMTKYEKLRIVLGLAQLIIAVILAYKFGG